MTVPFHARMTEQGRGNCSSEISGIMNINPYSFVCLFACVVKHLIIFWIDELLNHDGNNDTDNVV